MPKDQSKLDAVSPQNHNPLRADPGGLISDTDVVLGHAQVLREVTENGHIDESATMTIKFGSKVVENGMELSLDELATEPEVTITDSHGGGGGVFSLVLVDPDFPTPSNPKFKHTLYWCVNNILAGGAPFSASDFTVEYMPPDTPAGKGVHRHVFMLYRQAGGYDRFTPPHRRVSFQIKEWAKQHHMTPVAAVYFKVRHE